MKIDSVTSKGWMANVGDLARTTLVVLNDDSFPQGVDPEELDEDGALKNTGMSVVKAFAQHMYNDLHSGRQASLRDLSLSALADDSSHDVRCAQHCHSSIRMTQNLPAHRLHSGCLFPRQSFPVDACILGF